MSAGIDQARGDYVVLLHADLQDPPELIPQMLELAEEGADVVYARRIGREESRIKRGLATVFYNLMERLARVPYQGQAGDFRLMSRRVVDAIQRMPERRRFLRGMVAWAGFRQVPIEYRRAGRAHGRGASYPELFRLAVEALAAYSDVPLSLATIVGSAVAAASGAGGGGDRGAGARRRHRVVRARCWYCWRCSSWAACSSSASASSAATWPACTRSRCAGRCTCCRAWSARPQSRATAPPSRSEAPAESDSRSGVDRSRRTRRICRLAG